MKMEHEGGEFTINLDMVSALSTDLQNACVAAYRKASAEGEEPSNIVLGILWALGRVTGNSIRACDPVAHEAMESFVNIAMSGALDKATRERTSEDDS